MGFPIRKSTDQSLFAAPHGLSQRTTSFIACACQGIHQMPLRHLIVLIAHARQFPKDRSRRPPIEGTACAGRAARAATAVRPCEPQRVRDRPIVTDRTDCRERERRTSTPSFLFEPCPSGAACNGCPRSCGKAQPDETNVVPCRTTPLPIWQKDQLPETDPDDGGQAHQSVIERKGRPSHPTGYGAEASIQKAMNLLALCPGQDRFVASWAIQAILQDPSSLHSVIRTGDRTRWSQPQNLVSLPG